MTDKHTATNISVLGNMSWGTHFCFFYETKEDLLDTAAAFFKAGLENNEFFFWVLTDSIQLEETLNSLRKVIPELDTYLLEQKIGIVNQDQWFFKEGKLDPETILDTWKEKLNQALTNGFTGLRGIGDLSWLIDYYWKDFAVLERNLDQWINDLPMILLCAYPIEISRASIILDIVRTHNFTIARRSGEWELLETSGYKEAKAEIKRLKEVLEERVLQRTNELNIAKEELNRQKEILQKIFDNIPLMLIFFDENGRALLVNRAFEQTLGWTFEMLQQEGFDIYTACYPDPAYRREVAEFIKESKGEWADFKTTTHDGHLIDTSWSNIRLSDGSAIGIGQDITERKQKEEALRLSEERLKLSFEGSRDGLWDWNLETGDLFMSQRWYEMLDYQPGEFKGGYESINALVHPSDRKRFAKYIDSYKKADIQELEFRIKTKLGNYKWVLNRGKVFSRGKNGNPLRILGTQTDINERKSAEIALKRSEKHLQLLANHLVSIREEERIRIAREIHDELGQSLTALKIMLLSLETDLPKNLRKLKRKARDISGLISKDIQSVGRIVTMLRPEILDTLGLAEAIEWQAEETAQQTGINISVDVSQFKTELNEESITAVYRIFQEGLTNAVRHSKAGKIIIKLSSAANNCKLEIMDNGIGIEKKGKPSKISFGIIGMKERAQMLGGSLKISSRKNKGTKLQLTIPCRRV